VFDPRVIGAPALIAQIAAEHPVRDIHVEQRKHPAKAS
jgi:hypothetical protein